MLRLIYSLLILAVFIITITVSNDCVAIIIVGRGPGTDQWLR